MFTVAVCGFCVVCPRLLPWLCSGLCVQDDLPVEDMADDPTMADVITACKAADERKAENIVAILSLIHI